MSKKEIVPTSTRRDLARTAVGAYAAVTLGLPRNLYANFAGGSLEMLDYSLGLSQHIPQEWGSLDGLASEILSGNPQQRERLDYGSLETAMMVGVWECTQGSFKLTYTFNELATILEGRVTITFPDGSSHDFGPGDTHFAQKGDTATWTIHSEKVRKSFFIYTGDQVESTAAAQ